MTIPKEYYLQYAGKTPEQDILADTMSMPFQPVKVFPENAKINEKDWHNMLIFGDNLQALKHLLKLKKEGNLKNPDGSDGVKLVYIDPPFATERDFKGSQDQKAYLDKIEGSKFIEYIRKRLILLREVLADNGILYVHLDQRKGHYIKIILDEIFGEHNYVNEIIWGYSQGAKSKRMFGRKHDNIYAYSKFADKQIFNPDAVRIEMKSGKSSFGGRLETDEDGRKYRLVYGTKDKNGNTRYYKYYLDVGKIPEDYWTDINSLQSGVTERVEYPTQKPEALVERIIKASSSKGDIILDCFAGSGTTGAVAEKLGRKWIICDMGKLSIYTISKRMLDLKEEIGNTGKSLKPKTFILYNAGMYDYNLIDKMGEEDYKKFCLELFQCVPEDQDVNGFKMDGVRDNSPVHIFKGNYLTKDFIKSLHDTVGKHISKKMFIIAPDASVKFFEDWVQVKKGEQEIKYYILRIPYSIIDEIEKQHFKPLKQPDTSKLLNDIVESVGFDFIEPPEVQSEYSIAKPKNKLTQFAQIKIKKFKSNQRSKREKTVPDEEALSMVLIDADYDGKNFKLTHKVFKDEIKDNLVQFPPEVGNKVAVIFIDIYGNERIDVIDGKNFK